MQPQSMLNLLLPFLVGLPQVGSPPWCRFLEQLSEGDRSGYRCLRASILGSGPQAPTDDRLRRQLIGLFNRVCERCHPALRELTNGIVTVFQRTVRVLDPQFYGSAEVNHSQKINGAMTGNPILLTFWLRNDADKVSPGSFSLEPTLSS